LSPKLFTLIPHPAQNIPILEIGGMVARQENLLSIHYSVKGDIENILLPAPSSHTRKDDLWKATCFEFFIAVQDQPQYWEFNMSPSSEWNVYHMDAYRRMGFREEASIRQLPFEFKQTDEDLSLDLSIDLLPLIHLEQKIQLAITAIIQTRDGHETYWAIAHPGRQADFHLRESFVIET